MKTEQTRATLNPRLLLQRELERRCKANPRYSLRAFAKALELSPTILSLVLSGKRPLSRQAAHRIADRLSLRSDECLALLDWANTKPLRRALAPPPSSSPLNETSVYQMSLDSFALISDWYHYAILSLLEIPGAQFEASWIARHLGISHIEATAAMERLQRMEIVDQVDGRWKQATAPIRIGNNVPTAATKKFQKQLMLKAIESIENEPEENRDFSSMTFAIDPAQIPYAREEIRKFRRTLAQDLEARGSPKRVYQFTVQIFPVSQPLKETEKK
ncbi:DUF4423 domain-containing protein [Bdellovibrionota bacterium FG-1]